MNDAVQSFLAQYKTMADRDGSVVVGKFANPMDNCGVDADCRLDQPGIAATMQKAFPHIGIQRQTMLSTAIDESLDEMRRRGKTDSILRNVFTKYIYWMRDVFAVAASRGGKVLCENDAISGHELRFLRMLNRAGSYIVLIQKNGDAVYLKEDPKSVYSELLNMPGMMPFPPNFSLKSATIPQSVQSRPTTQPMPRPVQSSRPVQPPHPVQSPRPMQSTQPVQSMRPAQPPRPVQPRATQPAPQRNVSQPMPQRNIPQPSRPSMTSSKTLPQLNCTNAWMTGKWQEDLLLPFTVRGKDKPGFFCNAFLRIRGVEDRVTYQSEIAQLHQKMLSMGRKIAVSEGELTMPSPDEIAEIRRGNYNNVDFMIEGLADNLKAGYSVELQPILRRAFSDAMTSLPPMPLSRLTNYGVYLLCWLNRYKRELFSGWKMPEVACLFRLGACKNDKEALFFKMLARCPVDVVMLLPNLDEAGMVTDELLLDKQYEQTLAISRFPSVAQGAQMATAARRAEGDLDSLLFSDTGIYRDRQFAKANSIRLETIYEEISQLWDVDMKFRPNYAASDDSVTLPILCAKVCGVKDSDRSAYWWAIKKLMLPNTLYWNAFPHTQANPVPNVTDYYRNGKLQKQKLRSSKNYPFALLREETQEHVLDKLEMLIQQGIIAGTGVNGTEYTIISTVLSADKEILRLIQQFDFTKKNPKLVVVNTGETTASIEDSIMLAWLSLIGFDIVVFVPTGYRCVERWYVRPFLQEIEMGDYLYDMIIPDFSLLTKGPLQGLKNLFRRGK